MLDSVDKESSYEYAKDGYTYAKAGHALFGGKKTGNKRYGQSMPPLVNKEVIYPPDEDWVLSDGVIVCVSLTGNVLYIGLPTLVSHDVVLVYDKFRDTRGVESRHSRRTR
jgi:hypothetical protein